MEPWIFFAWQVEIVMIAVLIYGLIIFFRAIGNLTYKCKIPLLLILASLIVNIALGIMIGIFVTKQIDYNSWFWAIHPILGLLAASLLVFGGKKLFSVIEKER